MIEPVSTIGIFKSDLPALNRWCKKLNLTHAELIREWMRRVTLHDQAKFYDSLGRPDKTVKPLQGIKISNKYRK